MTSLSIMRDRFVRGWPRHSDGEPVHVLPLGNALARSYSSDAHCTQYTATVNRRLCREALDEGVVVEMGLIILDVDCTDAHDASEVAPESWRAEMRQKMHALFEVHPDPYYYETRGGARIIYRQLEPTVLRSQEAAREWSQQYAIVLAYFARSFGIVADAACADWQRLFRLPHATREPGQAPENWLVVGDPECIGTLKVAATHEDVEAAQASSKAFRERRVTNFAPCSADGQGLLFHALRARGDIIRPHGDGAFVVRCPNDSAHSKGRAGDSSTLLYLPPIGEEVGAVHCKHSHCVNLTAREWQSFFTRPELDAARIAAGIKRTA